MRFNAVLMCCVFSSITLAILASVIPLLTAAKQADSSVSMLPPQHLHAVTVGIPAIHLYWENQLVSKIGLRIERASGNGFETIATVAPDVTSFTDTDVWPGVFIYRVCFEIFVSDVVSCSGGAGATVLSAVATSAPKAPSAGAAQIDQFGAVILSWTDNADSENGFLIYRANFTTGEETVVGSFPAAQVTAPSTVYFVDYETEPNTEYFYLINAYSAGAGDAYFNSPATGVFIITPP